MIDHISIGVRDIAKSKQFYDAALKPLGYQCLQQRRRIARLWSRGGVALWISAVENPVPPDMKSGLHFCFTPRAAKGVDAFYAGALVAGGSDNGEPGFRDDYGATYYAAFVVDPDGYRIEAHCQQA